MNHGAQFFLISALLLSGTSLADDATTYEDCKKMAREKLYIDGPEVVRTCEEFHRKTCRDTLTGDEFQFDMPLAYRFCQQHWSNYKDIASCTKRLAGREERQPYFETNTYQRYLAAEDDCRKTELSEIKNQIYYGNCRHDLTRKLDLFDESVVSNESPLEREDEKFFLSRIKSFCTPKRAEPTPTESQLLDTVSCLQGIGDLFEDSEQYRYRAYRYALAHTKSDLFENCQTYPNLGSCLRTMMFSYELDFDASAEFCMVARDWARCMWPYRRLGASVDSATAACAIDMTEEKRDQTHDCMNVFIQSEISANKAISYCVTSPLSVFKFNDVNLEQLLVCMKDINPDKAESDRAFWACRTSSALVESLDERSLFSSCAENIQSLGGGTDDAFVICANDTARKDPLRYGKCALTLKPLYSDMGSALARCSTSKQALADPQKYFKCESEIKKNCPKGTGSFSCRLFCNESKIAFDQPEAYGKCIAENYVKNTTIYNARKICDAQVIAGPSAPKSKPAKPAQKPAQGSPK